MHSQRRVTAHFSVKCVCCTVLRSCIFGPTSDFHVDLRQFCRILTQALTPQALDIIEILIVTSGILTVSSVEM